VAALIGAVAIVVPLGLKLIQSKPRVAATNSRVIASGVSVFLNPHARRCQRGEYLPRDADRLRVFVGVEAGQASQPFELILRGTGPQVLARLQSPPSYKSGPLVLKLPPRSQSISNAQLCVQNKGARSLGFAGNLTSDQPQSPGAFNIPSERLGDEIRADYFLPGDKSWLDIAPKVADRFALFKPGWEGPWTLWAGLVLALLTAISGVALMVRQATRESA
jgi:hypothetical protein